MLKLSLNLRNRPGSELSCGGYFWIFVVLSLVGLASYAATSRLVYTSQRCNYSNEILQHLEKLSSALKDAHRGMRGFVITGEEVFLKPYHSALVKLRHEGQELSRLSAEDKRRNARLARIEPMVSSVALQFRTIVEARRTKGFDESAQEIQRGKIQAAADEAEQNIRAWEIEEEQSLQRASAVMTALSTGTKATAFLAIFSGLWWFGLGGVVVRRSLQDRERDQQALRRSEDRFKSLTQCLNDHSVVTLDASGHIQSWSDGAQQLTGYSRSEILGRHFSVQYVGQGATMAELDEMLRKAAGNGRHTVESWCIRKDGSKFLAREVISALPSDVGQPQGFMKVTFRDAPSYFQPVPTTATLETAALNPQAA